MSKRDLQKLGKRLKSLRIDRDLTQLELAEILDMSPNFIGMIEWGKEIRPLKMYLTSQEH